MKEFGTFDDIVQPIHDLITTRLEFCNSILYNLPNNRYNQVARMLKRIPWHNHITFFIVDCGMDSQDVPHLFNCTAHPNDLSHVNLSDKLVKTIRELSLLAPNDTAYKRWNCHGGYKLYCKLCPFFMYAATTLWWSLRG